MLARDPLCMCDGCQCCTHAGIMNPIRRCTRPTTDVAHIKRRRDTQDDSPENLRGLCHECHSSETVRKDGGLGR